MIASAFDTSSFWTTLAGAASGVAMWAQSKVSKPRVDPLVDLTDRLRNPRRRALSALRHPVRTLRMR